MDSYAKQVRVLSVQMPNKRKTTIARFNYSDSFLYAYYIFTGTFCALYSVRLFIFILINVIEMSKSYDAHSTHKHTRTTAAYAN